MANLVTQWEQFNALLRSELAREASKFNNSDLSDINIKFSGTLRDIYKGEQQTKVAISMYDLPNGLIGATQDQFNGTFVNNFNWGGNNAWKAITYQVRAPLNGPQAARIPTALELAGMVNQLPPLAN